MVKLTADQVRDIRHRYRKGLGPAIAAELGVSVTTVWRVATGLSWKHVAFLLLIAYR